ncbi:MAG TPA: hypothetical protein VM582_05375 [Candidatus Thermoplasmatota archaeon]|nr:hypothetical protein [Candidatus Thermoplasmatota archaeon]
MQRIDVLIVAALVAAAAASAVGIATYEDDRLASFTLAWTTRSETLDVPAVRQQGAGTVETTFAVERTNLTRVALSVTVSGAAARVQPVALHVELVSPTNASASAEGELPMGATGSIEVPVSMDLAPVPDAPSVTAPSFDAARRAVDASLSSTLGVGTWTLRATFAPGAPGPLGDEAYTVEAVATLTFYEATVALVGPEVGR